MGKKVSYLNFDHWNLYVKHLSVSTFQSSIFRKWGSSIESSSQWKDGWRKYICDSPVWLSLLESGWCYFTPPSVDEGGLERCVFMCRVKWWRGDGRGIPFNCNHSGSPAGIYMPCIQLKRWGEERRFPSKLKHKLKSTSNSSECSVCLASSLAIPKKLTEQY